MRVVLGLVVLAAGGVALGWWARQEYAPHMQSYLTERAAVAVHGAAHDVTVDVRGRDMTVRGYAEDAAERDRLVGALAGIRGHRVINDELVILPRVDPMTVSVRYFNGAIESEGHVPNVATQEAMAAEGAPGLELASGVPDRQWQGVALAGLQALRPLEQGSFELAGRHFAVMGVARTPVEGQMIQTLVSRLPDGYTANVQISYLDDGTPPVYTVNYTPHAGLWVEGKTPLGVYPDDIRDMMGFSAIDATVSPALLGEEAEVPAVLGAFTTWMDQLESLSVRVAAASVEAEAGFGAGADLELLDQAMRADIGDHPGFSLRVVEVGPDPESGTRRVHPLTGANEVLMGGFWLPAATFAPSADACATQVEAVLAANRIGFVSGSARLDAQARRSINALAGIVLHCVQGTALRAEVGGHTDSVGSEEGNLALSLARAQAVQAALVARGIAAEALSAQGYGASEPIADNATDEGRAANRRTTVRWIQ